MVNMKTEVWYGGTTGEGVEQAILSSCGETMAKDKADDLIVGHHNNFKGRRRFRDRISRNIG